MEYKFSNEETKQITENVVSRVTNGEENVKQVISEETQKIINNATAKTLSELNIKFKNELEKSFKDIDKVKGSYEKYFKTDIYSKSEQEKQKKLMDMELKIEIDDLNSTLDYEIKKFIKRFETDKSITTSMDYQMKLSNLLRLLELDKNLSIDFFDFIVEARDYNLLNLLKNKYKTEDLYILSHSMDKEKIEKIARQKANTLVSYLRQGDNFVPRSVLLEVVK